MPSYQYKDCPADIHAQLDRLRAGFARLLCDNLIGVYLHGSLATGCFNPRRSDIDLLVIVRHATDAATRRALARFLLAADAPAPVEMSVLRYGDLHPWQHPALFDFHFSKDWRERMLQEIAADAWTLWMDPTQCDPDLAGHITVTNARGVCLDGPPIAEVFPTVPRADFLDSVLADVLSDEYGLGAAAQHIPVYVILNACRTLATLHTGEILSKTEGGHWALRHLPREHHPVIDAALAAYRDDMNEAPFAVGGLEEFVQEMRAMITAASPATFSRDIQ